MNTVSSTLLTPSSLKRRDGSIEVFRCLMMLLVVLCHVAGSTHFKQEHWVVPIISITNLGVPGFVAISGWFGISFSWQKCFRLWAITFFYSALACLAALVATRLGILRATYHFRNDGGWFVGPYLILMAFAPLFNAGMETIRQKGDKALLAFYGALTGLLSFYWLGTVFPGFAKYVGLLFGGMGSKTAITLFYIYLTMRTCRLLDVDKKVPLKWLLVAFAFCAFCFTLLIAFVSYRQWGINDKTICWEITKYVSYHCPLTVWLACLLFLIFRHWHPAPVVTKVATFLGPSMFAIYLIHICSNVGISLTYGLPTQKLMKFFPALSKGVVILLITLFCYCLCLAIDLIRRGCLFGFCHIIHRKEYPCERAHE